MKIIIVGAGRIGINLSKSLAGENNEVYLIERDESVAAKIGDKLDVQVIVGSGSDPETLHKAPAEHADLVLAVTTSDETNLVVCALAAAFGVKRRIARVRNSALGSIIKDIGYDQFKVDEIINPELVAAHAIVQIIEAPGSTEVADFADGKILLRGFDISEKSALSHQTLSDFDDEDFPWPFLIVAILRNNEIIFPKGDTQILPGDHIYVLMEAMSLGEFLTLVNPDIKLAKKVIISGATITGKHVAAGLSRKVRDVILIEEDIEKAKSSADSLESVRVINGSAAESDILTECGIEAADVFIAATDNDHSNIISSVLAKKMGAQTTAITTQQVEYMAMADALDIDAIINPHHLAVKQILHLARGKGIRSVTKFAECDAEALEFIPAAGSPVTRDVVKNIKFPKNSIVGAVDKGDKVVLVNGDTQIEEGQKVVVFCQEKAVRKLQKLFSGN